MTISFVSHEFTQPVKNKPKLKDWLKPLLKRKKNPLDNLTYIFTNDDYLHDLNKKYLHHNTFTDIQSPLITAMRTATWIRRYFYQH